MTEVGVTAHHAPCWSSRFSAPDTSVELEWTVSVRAGRALPELVSVDPDLLLDRCHGGTRLQPLVLLFNNLRRQVAEGAGLAIFVGCILESLSHRSGCYSHLALHSTLLAGGSPARVTETTRLLPV